MRTMGIILWATLGTATAFGSMGCSSSTSGGSGGGGAAPDFGTLETTLTKPTGTFDETQAGPVTDGFNTQLTASESNGLGGGSSSSSKSFMGGELALTSLEPQNVNASCPGLKSGGAGSCACPMGGTITYDLPPGGVEKVLGDKTNTAPIDQTISLKVAACGDEASVYDGSYYIKVKSAQADRKDLFILYAIHLAVTGAKMGKYDVDYLLKDGKVTFAIEVKDGKVLVSASGNWDKKTKTGTITVTDKNGTWTCMAVNGKGMCTDKDGKTHTFG